MASLIKQFLLLALVIAVGYGAMSYHLIFDGWGIPHTLPKNSLHLHETFYSISRKKPETIMREEHLCYAGVGQLLVDLGSITNEEQYRLENKFCPPY